MKPPVDNSSRSRSNHVTGSVVESIFVFLPLYHLLLKTSPDNVKHDKHNHGLSCSLSPLLAAVMSPLCFYLKESSPVKALCCSSTHCQCISYPLIDAICSEKGIIIRTMIKEDRLDWRRTNFPPFVSVLTLRFEADGHV